MSDEEFHQLHQDAVHTAKASLAESLKDADSELILEMSSQLNDILDMFKENHHRANRLNCVSSLTFFTF